MGFQARCGLWFVGTKRAIRHQELCTECNLVKRQHIKERQLNHNTSDAQRLAASIAAKKTSSRRDIQLQRASRLRKWQLEHPEEFRAIIMKLQSSPKNKSKADEWLRTKIPWPQGQVSCGSDRKQVDFVSDNVWIEVDGFWHFFLPARKKDRRPSRLKRTLLSVQDRDVMLNHEAIRRGVMLLRIAGSCFKSHTGEMREEWLPIVLAMLRYPTPGVWCLGRLYEYAPWAQKECTILKFPTQSIISFFPMVQLLLTVIQSVTSISPMLVYG